jgi:hypothetical protein
MLKFAFYKATPGRFTDRLIRFASGSPYSHVEFVLREYSTKGRPMMFCVSASKRDGKQVRKRSIPIKVGHWDFVTVSGDYLAAADYAGSMGGQPYNMIGAALSITPFSAKLGRGLFCSEFMALIANAGGMDIPDPHTLTPGEFYDLLQSEQ